MELLKFPTGDEVKEPKNLNFTILVDMQHVRSW